MSANNEGLRVFSLYWTHAPVHINCAVYIFNEDTLNELYYLNGEHGNRNTINRINRLLIGFVRVRRHVRERVAVDRDGRLLGGGSLADARHIQPGTNWRKGPRLGRLQPTAPAAPTALRPDAMNNKWGGF